jgi:hypothetical protein
MKLYKQDQAVIDEYAKKVAIAMDNHNQKLVREVIRILEDTQMRSMLTDLELLDNIAEVVNKRKLVWGLTDCNTGLMYDKATF